MALTSELERNGFTAKQAFDGKSGLEIAISMKPDLILLDLILPGTSGFDVLKELKESPITSGIPVIIISALEQDEDIKRGLKMGALDYFAKSNNTLAEIVEKINNFLKYGKTNSGANSQKPAE